MQRLLLAMACFVALLAGAQAQGEVDPSRIVADVNKDCPINNTLYTEDEFSVSKLFGLMTPMVSQGSGDSPCARAVPNLAGCATDGSLQVKEGCCSTACAGKMQEALVNSGRQCYREFIEVMCNSTELRESVSGVLFGAAKRCLGLQPSCELLSQPGDLLNATTTADSTRNASNAADSLQQKQGTNTQPSTVTTTSSGNVTSTGGDSGSSSTTSPNVGNSLGMNQLAAALQAQEDAPHAAPDPFMTLVPRPVESASSTVVLATPDEIDAAAARNGSRSRTTSNQLVGSNLTTPANSSAAAGATNSTQPRTPLGAQALASPAAAAAVAPETEVPTSAAAPPPAASASSSSLFDISWSGVAFALVLLLVAVL